STKVPLIGAMKIAQVTATFPPYWGGTGNVVAETARLLHERGHVVTVLTGQRPGTEVIDFPFGIEYLPALLRLGNAPLTPHLVGKLRGYDLVHLHYPFIFGAEITCGAARYWRIPLVLTYHNELLEVQPVKRVLF